MDSADATPPKSNNSARVTKIETALDITLPTVKLTNPASWRNQAWNALA